LDVFLHRYPKRSPIDKIIVGGGPLSKPLVERGRQNSAIIHHTYGSTETCTHVAVCSVSDGESIFRAIGNVTFDIDSSRKLIVHTPHLQEETHHTTDIVELIDSNSFRWVGRSDNVILSGGLKFHAEDLEARCASLIQGEFYFAAEPHPELGEALVLHVEGDNTTVEEIRKKLAGVLDEHELPKRIIVHGSFERTASGKVIRS